MNPEETNENQDFENLNNEEKENIERMVDDVIEESTAVEEETTIDPLAQSQQQLQETKDKYLRLYAEFDNFKKRTAKERVELMKTAGQQVIRDFLPVLDDFERAMKALDIDKNNPQKEDEGMRLIYHKLLRSLQGHGLQQMEIMGDDFNADFHEAITQIAAGDEMKGKVVDVIEQGYMLNDIIIRYAKVVIGS